MSKCNRLELAEFLEASRTTVDRYIDKGLPFLRKPGVPADNKEWLFSTGDVVKWMVANVEGNGSGTSVGRDAKEREQVANAGLKELDLAERLGFLVDEDTIMQHITAGDAIVKSRLLAVPARTSQALAFETDPVECERIVRTEINSALAELEKDWKERG